MARWYLGRAPLPLQTVQSKGFRLNRTKTEYMICGFSTARCEEEEEVSLDWQVVPQKDTFRYLGSMLHEDGAIDEPSSQSRMDEVATSFLHSL